MKVMYCILCKFQSDYNLSMGNGRFFPSKILQVHCTVRHQGNNTADNNGRQLTGGVSSAVVITTVRRVANLSRQHITSLNENSHSRPFPAHGF